MGTGPKLKSWASSSGVVAYRGIVAVGAVVIALQILGLIYLYALSNLVIPSGLSYFAIWLVTALRYQNDKNKKVVNIDDLRRYFKIPAILLLLDFGLMGFFVGTVLADQYSELFSPLLSLLAMLNLEWPLLAFSSADLKEEIKKVFLPIMSGLLAIGYLALLMGLLPYSNVSVRAAAIAVVTVILATTILLSFMIALLHEPKREGHLAKQEDRAVQ